MKKNLRHDNLPIPADGARLTTNAAEPPLTVTIAEIPSQVGISRSEIYRLLAAGKLRAVKSGSRTLILWSIVLSFLDSLPAATFTAQSGRTR